VGQLFTVASSGTITQVCLYLKAGTETATYRVSSGGDGSSTGFSVFSGTVAAHGVDGWSCDNTQSHAWSAGPVLISIDAGANAAYTSYAATTGGYGMDGTGSTWSRQTGYNRGFGFTYSTTGGTAPATYPADYGAGSGNWDGNSVRTGDVWQNRPTGTLTQLCAYMRGNGQQIVLAVGTSLSSVSNVYSTTITAGSSEGWVCASPNIAWTSSTIVVYRDSGMGEMSYRVGVSGGHSVYQSGTSWVTQTDTDRGFGFTIV
jgi:hypothetical protein